MSVEDRNIDDEIKEKAFHHLKEYLEDFREGQIKQYPFLQNCELKLGALPYLVDKCFTSKLEKLDLTEGLDLKELDRVCSGSNWM